MALWKYVIRRLIQIVIIFFVILTVLFFVFRLAPGDPISRMIDPDMTPEDIEHFRDAFGLNDSVWVQYVKYLMNITRGEFGNSFHYDAPVIGIIKEKLLIPFLKLILAKLFYPIIL